MADVRHRRSVTSASIEKVSWQKITVDLHLIPRRGEGETAIVAREGDSLRTIVINVSKELRYRVVEAVDGNEAIALIGRKDCSIC